MGSFGSIRLAAHGNQTPITPSNIYFLDNRFHPLATSQKVCDAWRKQSEQMASWRSSVRWSTRVKAQAWARTIWRTGSSAINLSWRALRAANAGSTLSSWSFWRAPSALTRSRFWRSSKPPRSPTIEFENNAFLGRTALDVPSQDQFPQGRAVSQRPPCAACGSSERLMTPCRKFSATVQEVSKQ